MQPLISVDHETRHNSYRQNDDVRPVSEDTPLLQRFPPVRTANGIATATTAVVTILIVILISGIVIGTYLLIIQSNSENILPPVEHPMQLVSRSQWDPSRPAPVLQQSPYKATYVVAVQTDTGLCNSTHTCSQLLHNVQATSSLVESLPYNFLVSSNGQTFEGLGWRQSSPMFRQYAQTALVLAFIGNFTDIAPTHAQLNEAKNWLAESVSLQHLSPSFTIVGKRTHFTPKCLLKKLRRMPQWNAQLSDDDI